MQASGAEAQARPGKSQPGVDAVHAWPQLPQRTEIDAAMQASGTVTPGIIRYLLAAIDEAPNVQPKYVRAFKESIILAADRGLEIYPELLQICEFLQRIAKLARVTP